MLEILTAEDEIGQVETPRGSIVYRRVNPGIGLPLLVIHGGPGAGHRYLRKLDQLATTREIVFYDQLGCGWSNMVNPMPAADTLTPWNIQQFADEIDSVREHLGLELVHLLGHSSGGWFALEYLSRRPDGVQSVVLANTAASVADFAHGIDDLINALDDSDRRLIRSYESDPWSTDEEYLNAIAKFYARHLIPDTTKARKLMAIQRSSDVYTTMIGPHELAVVGNLAGWDRRTELAEITVPALVLAGAHDHNTPEAAQVLADGLPISEFVVLDNCGHDPFNESPSVTMPLVASFLAANDPSR